MKCSICGCVYGNTGTTEQGEYNICEGCRRKYTSLKDLAAAQATIEKQRKVIEWFASRPHVFEKSPCKMCIKYLNDGCPHPPDRECAAGVIAYAEKQVEGK